MRPPPLFLPYLSLEHRLLLSQSWSRLPQPPNRLEARIRDRIFASKGAELLHWNTAAAFLPVVERALPLCDSPEALDRFFLRVGHRLLRLGLEARFLPRAFEGLRDLLRTELGEAFTPEVDEAWQAFFVHAVDRITSLEATQVRR